MRRDSRLSTALHLLLHMSQRPRPMTSAELSSCLETNPVVVRRVLAGLRREGLVRSEKGHGGGWRIASDLRRISLRDVYIALGEPVLFHQEVGGRPGCLVAKTVGRALGATFDDARVLVEKRLAGVRLSELSRELRVEAAGRRSAHER